MHVSTVSLHDNALAPASGLTRVLAPLHLSNHKLKGFEYVLIVPCTRLGPRALEFFGKGFAVFGGDLALFGTEVGLVAHDDNGDPIDGLDVAGGQFSAYTAQIWRKGKKCRGYTYKVVQDLVTDDACHFVALFAGDRVDNDVAMNTNEMFRIEDAVLILEGDGVVSQNTPKSSVKSDIGAHKKPVHGSCVWVGCGDARRDAGRKKSSKYLSSGINDLGRKVLVLIPDHLAECILNSGIVAVDKVAVDKLHRHTRFACAGRQSGTSHMLSERASCEAPGRKQLTHGPAAHNGHLSLLGSRHLAAGFGRGS
jgi:hypothetical protein